MMKSAPMKRLTFFKNAGFTLVEVQIALLILLLIVAVLMGGLKLAAKSTNAAEKLVKQTSDVRIITSFIQKQITSILPLKSLRNGKTKLLFKGQHSEVYYTGHLPEHVVNGGPWLIHLHQKKEQLLLNYRAIDNTRSFTENINSDFATVVLLENVDDFSIEYLSKRHGSWQSTWHKADFMPALIKIQLSQNNRLWPDIVVPLYSHLAVKTPFHVLEISK
jgi:general secretion pathway protein J